MTDLLVLGFDGLDFTTMSIYNKEGIVGFPFRNDAVIGLHSLAESTGPSWTTLYTGVPHSEHGVTDVWGLNRNGSKTFLDLDVDFIWDLLGSVGIKTCMWNLPVTYPAKQVENGYMVSGYPYVQDDWLTMDEDIYYSLPDDYTQWACVKGWQSGEASEDWGKAIHGRDIDEILDKVFANAKRLIDLISKNYRGESFIFTQFDFVDCIGHMRGFYPRNEDMLKTYLVVAGIIQHALNRLAPKTLWLVSDHGFVLDQHSPFGTFAMHGEKTPEMLEYIYNPHTISVDRCGRKLHDMDFFNLVLDYYVSDVED